MEKNTIRKLESHCCKLRVATHPVRAVIIDLLSKNSFLTVTEIHMQLNINQPTASHHLNILKNNGLLTSRREGKMILYSLETNVMENLIEVLFPALCSR